MHFRALKKALEYSTIPDFQKDDDVFFALGHRFSFTHKGINNHPVRPYLERYAGIYFLCDKHKEVLYIGKSNKSLYSRIYQHIMRQPSSRKLLENYKHIRWVYPCILINHPVEPIEKYAIEVALPPCNTFGITRKYC